MAARPLTGNAVELSNTGDSHDIDAGILDTVEQIRMSQLRKVVLTLQLSGINLIASSVTGLVVIGIPRIASDLSLPQELYFWPSSVYGLATASTLLLAGTIADIVGARTVDLTGCFSLAVFILGSGFVQTGTQLVVFRAIQGVAMSLHLSSSVGLVTANMPRGRGRNIAFSCLGLSQPLGFSIGLVVGGVFVDTIGWRMGWYLAGGITLLLAVVGLWALPKTRVPRTSVLGSLVTKIDWVGAVLASTSMATLSYVLAIISTDIERIKDGECVALLCISLLAIPAFIGWVHRQVRLGKPALIPNNLWRNMSFATTCLSVLLSFSVLQSMEQYSSLFFQEIQHLPALQASVRILPSLVVGTILNFTTGLFVDKVPALWLVAVSSLLCAGAPLLMAVVQPEWPYWYNAFFAQLLQPVSGDILFTVGLIIVSDVFPEDTQALAGAVFNTASQFGNSLGLAIMQVVSTLTAKNAAPWMSKPEAILSGYRASFWTMFALMVSCFFLGAFGLRKTGKVGTKRD